MSAITSFLDQADSAAREKFGPLLEEPAASSVPPWANAQDRFLTALDAYVDDELARPIDFEIQSHEAGGQCRVWFPHYRVRGRRDMMDRMRAIIDARIGWTSENLFHGYVDCHEVHHEPETFMYFQVPLMLLTGMEIAKDSVENFSHHVGNWSDGAPDWYDWSTHSFLSTWLGTKEIRNHPPYDYQEANHFRFVAIGLASHVAGRGDRYLELAEDYAARWCDHIEARATAGEPIECSILPDGARRKEMGFGGEIKEEVEEGEYPVFYATVAQNTTYDIVTVMLDLFRLTGKDRYQVAARVMIAQFFDHVDEDGRPPFSFSNGEWVYRKGDATNLVRAALGGSNDLLVRMADKYRAIAKDTCFDAALLRWAGVVDEGNEPHDQLPISLMVVAHRITGESDYLTRACEMAVRGIAVTEANTHWHQCDSSGRYGFKYPTDVVYHAMVAGVDYATRGGLPLVGLSFETEGRPGLPNGCAFRSWESEPGNLQAEAVNKTEEEISWLILPKGEGRSPSDLVKEGEDGHLEIGEDGWRVSLPGGGSLSLKGTLVASD